MKPSGIQAQQPIGPDAPNFADRLLEAIRRKSSVLVVGLDPVLERLPQDVLQRAGVDPSMPDAVGARAAEAFRLFLGGVIEAVADAAVAVKPNLAFFERWGAPGWEAFEGVSRKAKEMGLLVIADAKRGDIGHTAEAYASAFLGDSPATPGPLVDAVTVNPYLGSDSMAPFLERSRQTGKGLFVLVRTSNPSAGEIQDLDAGGIPVYLRVARLVARWGEGLRGTSGFSLVGAVVGATAPEEAARIRQALPSVHFLVPGYGAQGAKADQLRAAFLPGGAGAIGSARRRFPPRWLRE